MTLERACQCGALYFATSAYDYSCPRCWLAECHAAVRWIEWVGGVAPPGCIVIEKTPITSTWEQARDFLCGPWSAEHYIGDGQIVPCLVSRYSKPWTPAIPVEWIIGEDISESHPEGLYYELEPGRAFPPSGDGWWWLETEVAWVADPTEITCDEEECCLARADR